MVAPDLATLDEQVATLSDRQRDDLHALFPRLTLLDAAAVVLQRPGATDVRPYIGWLRTGRRVRHGERGIVLPPQVAGVTRARVFDIDQTDDDAGAKAAARRPPAPPDPGLIVPPAVQVVPMTNPPAPPMPLATSRYAGFNPDWGVPVRITVGPPRGFRHPHEQALALAPYELFKPPYKGIDDVHVEQLVYTRRLESHTDEILAQLAAVAAKHPGRRAVLLCFENVLAGEACHRRWAAEWFKLRFGWDVPEIGAEPPQALSPASMPEQPTLF